MFMVEVAYKICRYEDCLEYLTPLLKNSTDVDIKKLKMWSNCHKKIINKQRSAWCILLSQEKNADTNNVDPSILNEYKLSILSDIKHTCNNTIQFIDNYLMNAVSNVNHRILLYQICGDYHRYKAEVCFGETMLDNYNEALDRYKHGWQLCLQNNVGALIILSFAVKYAICLKSLHHTDSAILLLEEALTLANTYSFEDANVNIIIDHITRYKQTLTKAENKISNS